MVRLVRLNKNNFAILVVEDISLKLLWIFWERNMCWTLWQFSTDDLVKEVENSIAEFKRHKQEYDEERVKDQVSTLNAIIESECWIRGVNSFFFRSL